MFPSTEIRLILFSIESFSDTFMDSFIDSFNESGQRLFGVDMLSRLKIVFFFPVTEKTEQQLQQQQRACCLNFGGNERRRRRVTQAWLRPPEVAAAPQLPGVFLFVYTVHWRKTRVKLYISL